MEKNLDRTLTEHKPQLKALDLQKCLYLVAFYLGSPTVTIAEKNIMFLFRGFEEEIEITFRRD